MSQTSSGKSVARAYLAATWLAFFAAGVLALVIRAKHWQPTVDWLGPESYLRLTSLHGFLMMFVFALPGLASWLGHLLLPGMSGVMAYPRLSGIGFLLFAQGSLVGVWASVQGNLTGGWSLLSSSEKYMGAPLALGAILLLSLSRACDGWNFAATVWRDRRERSPLRDPFAAAMLAEGALCMLILPVLLAVFVALFSGDQLWFSRFMRSLVLPSVYIFIPPGMGAISAILERRVGGAMVRRELAAWGMLGVGALGILRFVVWILALSDPHSRLLTARIPEQIMLAAGVPMLLCAASWGLTLYHHRVKLLRPLSVPVLYCLATVLALTVGGYTGVVLSLSPYRLQLLGSYYLVAHFHTILLGTVVTAALAALHEWWELITGRRYDERLSMIGFGVLLAGFALALAPQFALGLDGMFRHLHEYPPAMTLLNRVSTVGAWVIVAGALLHVAALLPSRR